MPNSRRQFLNRTSAALMGVLTACRKPTPESPTLPPGAPTAFGTAPDAGPPVSASTFAEAEKLVQFDLSPMERQTAAGSWRKSMAPLYERRTGPRKFFPPPSISPAARWDPKLPGQQVGPDRDRFIRTASAPGSLPANDEDIAFAPLSLLSRWIEARQLTSERLTRLYLDRLDTSIPNCAASSRSRAIWLCRKPNRPIARSPRDATGARCMAYHGAPRTCWTPPEFPPPTAPSHSATACPRKMPWS